MILVESGTLVTGVGGTNSAFNTFPALVTLDDGTCFVTFRSGSTKDSDDERIRLLRSADAGSTWIEIESPFVAPSIDEKQGSLKLCYLTAIDARRIVAAAMWIDRSSFPGRNLFNDATEGCLPMQILISESADSGRHWTPFRRIPMPADVGPPSLTNPIVRLPNGELLLSIETNKHYEDASQWFQRAIIFRSSDEGVSWSGPEPVSRDPSGRTFFWDQRMAADAKGTLATFQWTYDRTNQRYLNIHRKISSDSGRTWRCAEVLGFADQPSHPAVSSTGQSVLAYVDRFQSRSIRVRTAEDLAGEFDRDSEIVLYSHGSSDGSDSVATGELLEQMSDWSFGLPYVEMMPDGSAMVLYYAGTDVSMDIRYGKIEL